MKLAVIGTGYVGLVSGVCFTLNGNHVICVDKDEEKINKLNRMESPIYEPGIEALIEMNLREGRLSFSSDLQESVRPLRYRHSCRGYTFPAGRRSRPEVYRRCRCRDCPGDGRLQDHHDQVDRPCWHQ